MMFKKVFILIILLLFSINSSLALTGYEQGFNQNNAIFLNYNDLVELSKTALPMGKLKQKLESQLNTPIIYQPPSEKINFLSGKILGDFFRVTSWNIERGFNVQLIEDLFLHPNIKGFPWQIHESEESLNELQSELNILTKSSILMFDEVDIGLPRTNYENIAERLAKTFKMGYIYGTEFVEVDPYQLGVKKFTKEERTFLEDKSLEQLDNIDQNKYKGLHGTAIFSKYPITNAKIIRIPDCYNWYKEESNKLSALELARREAAEKVFSSKVLTELRHGGRIAVIADLLLPNNQKITAVAVHLENRCLPKCRVKQFEFLLNRLRNIRNPVIIAGDLNTTGADASPVSIKKEVLKKVKDPEFIAKQAILSLTPISLAQNLILNTANSLRQYKDPTTKDIPIILPNKERKIFDLLKEFRFNDSGTFDVRGLPEKTHRGNAGFLSNSNERDLKGFKTSFELERHFGIAKYKLDWIFVKPLQLKEPNNKKSSYAYAPHFGRTLKLLNRTLSKEPISDHDPITIDIPIGEPLKK